MIFDRHTNHFWARECSVHQEQLEEEQIADQIRMKEYMTPFTGSKRTKIYSSFPPKPEVLTHYIGNGPVRQVDRKEE